jgi:hypothetical protein
MRLPPPECELGYPVSQLEQLLDEQQMSRLHLWMRGQTGAICDGTRYDHDIDALLPSGCGPHGLVYYPWDVERWAAARPIVDW